MGASRRMDTIYTLVKPGCILIMRIDPRRILNRLMSHPLIRSFSPTSPEEGNTLVSMADSEHNIEKRLKNLESANANLKQRDTDPLNKLREQKRTASSKRLKLSTKKIRLPRQLKPSSNEPPAYWKYSRQCFAQQRKSSGSHPTCSIPGSTC